MSDGTIEINEEDQTILGYCVLCAMGFQLATGNFMAVLFGTWPLFMVLQCPHCGEEHDYLVAMREDRDDQNMSCDVCDAENDQEVEAQDAAASADDGETDSDMGDGESDGGDGDGDE